MEIQIEKECAARWRTVWRWHLVLVFRGFYRWVSEHSACWPSRGPILTVKGAAAVFTGGCPSAVPDGLRKDPLLGFTSGIEKKSRK